MPNPPRIRSSSRRPRTLAIALCLTLASLLFSTAAARVSPALNDASRASQLIAEVNALRASNGLPPFVPDPILMSVAARQNDWRVSVGATSHTGPDGSSPKQRAAAAGYGGGATIFISENIADGTGLTPAQAVQWWTGDAPHLNTMLGPNYVNVGAGAGESDGIWRYTLMAGYVAGGSYQPGKAPSPLPAASQPAPVVPLVKATALPNGSLIHVVRTGQSLWTIAAIYGVDLDTLMTLNGLTSTSVLHEGDRIIIEPSWTPTTSPHPASPTVSPPSGTNTPQPTVGATEIKASPTPSPSPDTPLTERLAALRPANMILIGLGLLLVLAGVIFAFRT
jgi:uncharacterized protein YkwD